MRAHLPSISFGKIDLSNFFYSVHRNRITRCLKALGLQFADADAFAVASTVHVSSPHHRFALPFGFLQSPILASIALDHSALGNALRSLHEDGLIVSVYVDDILISSSTEKRVNEALNVLQEAATLSSFPINKTKTHGPTDAIAAFNIVLGSNEMRITKERMESLSQAVLMHGPGPASNGILGYVASVNEMQANNLLSALPRSFPHLNT